MNISSGDDLYVSGFNRELRDDAVSVAKSYASMSIASSTYSLLHTKSESSGSPQSATAAAPTEDGPIEVDFYRNPTILSRMILYNKFANAAKRCRDHPQEAAVWVCAKRKSNVTQVAPFYGMFDRSKRSTRTMGGNVPQQQAQQQQQQQQQSDNQYSLRQLPIHIACTSLAFAHDATSRTELEQLIVRLVVTHPAGCAEFDHGGKLPLHEAIWSNASPETTAMLLMASPQSIERRDKFGRTPMELNNRRTGQEHKAEIRDMLLLGVHYWDQARQEAKLRMKLANAPPPSGDKSIDSTSVLGTSQIEKETIYTTDSVALPERPKPHPVQIESEEIVPMAWEQLERRVLLLEQLLAEMYEKNYELAGLVEELKKEKVALTAELQAARAAASSPPLQPSLGHVAPRSPRSSFGSAPSVAVVPEDDEVSSIKLMEHAERIEQLESLVGSYHDSKRKRRNTTGSGSKISELSSVSSHTNEGALVRHRTGLARQDSLVSGLTEEASYFDTSMHAVKDTWGNSKEEEDTAAEGAGLGTTSSLQVSKVLGTDNLNEMFHKAAELHGSSRTFSDVQMQTPRKEWAPPIAATSFLSTEADMPSPMAVEEEEEEDLRSMSSAPRIDSKLPATPTNASDIYFPGFRLDPAPAHVNSTISVSASSVDSSAIAMSENSTIVSDEREIYFAVHRDSVGTLEDTVDEEQVSSATRSTRARLENLVFGSGSEDDDNDADDQEQAEGSERQPQRYNFDISIPALDTFYPETGEI